MNLRDLVSANTDFHIFIHTFIGFKSFGGKMIIDLIS